MQSGYLTEYESLRTEIMKRIQARDLILGITLAALGAILSIVFSVDLEDIQRLNESNEPTAIHLRAFALISVAFIFVFGAVMFTLHHTRMIVAISGFIRVYIEPNVKGVGWESNLTALRTKTKTRELDSRRPTETTMYFGAYYALITVSLALLSAFLDLHRFTWMAIVHAGLCLLCLAAEWWMCRRSMTGRQGWDVNWAELRDLQQDDV